MFYTPTAAHDCPDSIARFLAWLCETRSNSPSWPGTDLIEEAVLELVVLLTQLPKGL